MDTELLDYAHVCPGRKFEQKEKVVAIAMVNVLRAQLRDIVETLMEGNGTPDSRVGVFKECFSGATEVSVTGMLDPSDPAKHLWFGQRELFIRFCQISTPLQQSFVLAVRKLLKDSKQERLEITDVPWSRSGKSCKTILVQLDRHEDLSFNLLN